MNTNPIHKWLRDPKCASVPAVIEGDVSETPSILSLESVNRFATAQPSTVGAVNVTSGDRLIEIDSVGGHQLRIVAGSDPEALARLILGLST